MGLQTSSGGRVRARALIRSDRLDRLTPVGVAAVRAYGVSRIIDLRTAGEVRDVPGPFSDDPMYRHAPFIDEQEDLRRDPVAESTPLALYRGSIDRNGRCIGVGVAAFATAPNGGVVVHCAGGKDRTGLLVALMLRAVGVAADEIAADYALTAECLRERHEAELAAETDPDARDRLRQLQGCEPETIIGTLSYVDDRFGGSARYLASAGVTGGQLARLRARLVEE